MAEYLVGHRESTTALIESSDRAGAQRRQHVAVGHAVRHHELAQRVEALIATEDQVKKDMEELRAIDDTVEINLTFNPPPRADDDEKARRGIRVRARGGPANILKSCL